MMGYVQGEHGKHGERGFLDFLIEQISLFMEFIQQQEKIVMKLQDIMDALGRLKTDQETLTVAVGELVNAAHAGGGISPADAQTVVDAVNAQDAAVKALTDSVKANLPPVPPA